MPLLLLTAALYLVFLLLPVGAQSANGAPTFDAGESTTVTVAKNTAAHGNVGSPVTATDPDSDSLTYSLSGNEAGAFGIVSASGQILTKDPLDFETDDSYSVTVEVTDGKDAGGNPDSTIDDTISVTVNLTNEEEPGTVSLDSTSPYEVFELTATLSDPDGSVSGES